MYIGIGMTLEERRDVTGRRQPKAPAGRNNSPPPPGHSCALRLGCLFGGGHRTTIVTAWTALPP
jgi:hypothetical protein